MPFPDSRSEASDATVVTPRSWDRGFRDPRWEVLPNRAAKIPTSTAPPQTGSGPSPRDATQRPNAIGGAIHRSGDTPEQFTLEIVEVDRLVIHHGLVESCARRQQPFRNCHRCHPFALPWICWATRCDRRGKRGGQAPAPWNPSDSHLPLAVFLLQPCRCLSVRGYRPLNSCCCSRRRAVSFSGFWLALGPCYCLDSLSW